MCTVERIRTDKHTESTSPSLYLYYYYCRNYYHCYYYYVVFVIIIISEETHKHPYIVTYGYCCKVLLLFE